MDVFCTRCMQKHLMLTVTIYLIHYLIHFSFYLGILKFKIKIKNYQNPNSH